MARLHELFRRLRLLVTRAQADRDLDEEIRLHVDLLAQQRRARGLTPAEAEAQAHRRFGNAARIKEDTRDAAGWRWLDDLIRDVRYAARSLVRHKAFASASIITLGLGIGATTEIFTVVNAVVLRPLPFPAADRLVKISGTPVERGQAIPHADVDAFREQAGSFAGIAGYAVTAKYLRGSGESERIMAVLAERNLFDVLGVRALVGRVFQSDDPATVTVISERFWRSRLGGSASVAGTTLMLDGEPYTVVGVVSDQFQFPYSAASTLPSALADSRIDLYVPMYALGQPPRGRIPGIVGRLKQDATLSAARSELAVIVTRAQTANPTAFNQGRGVAIVPLAEAVVAATVRRPLFFLFGAVGIVLALACANVTNLSMVRVTLRAREVAVRAAMGASPSRLVRQFLTESTILSLAGGAVGLWIARLGTTRLMQLGGAQIPRAREVGFDWTAFLFLFGACLATGAAFGLAPALIARRTDPQAVLKETGGHGTMGVGLRRLRDGLVVVEVALAFVLAVGGVLLVRELIRLRTVDPGLVSSNVITFHVGHRMVPQNDGSQYYDIADRVTALPGIRAAGFTQLLPLQSWGWSSVSTDFTVRGEPAPEGPPFSIELRYVTPGFFNALGVGIARGRGFTAADTRDSLPVILINQTLARRQFGDADPIGKVTTRGVIVGIVRDVRQVHLDRPANPEIYYPIAQNWSQVSELGMTLVVATEGPPEASIDRVRSIVRDVNPNFAVFAIKTFNAVIEESMSSFTLYLSLMAGFAVLALLLALTGTYGVISYVATARMREFAIRLAVGADKASVLRLVLLHGTRLASLGIAAGLVIVAAATPLLQNLPVSVRPPGAVLSIAVAVGIGLAALIATILPARRASTTEPMEVLRTE